MADDMSVSNTTCTCARAEDLCHHRAALLLHAKDNLSKGE